LPSAVRIFFGNFEIVFRRLAAAAAFLTFLRAADLCFDVVIVVSSGCVAGGLPLDPA
jgi:hypothetical protein